MIDVPAANPVSALMGLSASSTAAEATATAAEATATTAEPTSTAANAAAAAAWPVTARTPPSGAIEIARPLRAVHPCAAIAIQLCGGIAAHTALCGAIAPLPRGAHRTIDIRPAAIAVFLPAATLVAVDVPVMAGIDVARTRFADSCVALQPTAGQRVAAAAALC